MLPPTLAGYISGYVTGAQKQAVRAYRRRMQRKGFVRLELRAREQDAALLRSVAAALADPDREAEARRVLTASFADAPAIDLKALLASAPLEGVDLERRRDLPRDVEL